MAKKKNTNNKLEKTKILPPPNKTHQSINQNKIISKLCRTKAELVVQPFYSNMINFNIQA